ATSQRRPLSFFFFKQKTAYEISHTAASGGSCQFWRAGTLTACGGDGLPFSRTAARAPPKSKTRSPSRRWTSSSSPPRPPQSARRKFGSAWTVACRSECHEGRRSGGWTGDTAAPHDGGHEQTPATGLRPADDLLPRTDASPLRNRRDPRGHWRRPRRRVHEAAR